MFKSWTLYICLRHKLIFHRWKSCQLWQRDWCVSRFEMKKVKDAPIQRVWQTCEHRIRDVWIWLGHEFRASPQKAQTLASSCWVSHFCTRHAREVWHMGLVHFNESCGEKWFSPNESQLVAVSFSTTVRKRKRESPSLLCWSAGKHSKLLMRRRCSEKLKLLAW